MLILKGQKKMEQTSSSNLRTWFLKLPKWCKLSGVDMPTPFPVTVTRIHHTFSRVSLLESLLRTAGRGSIPTRTHVKNQKKTDPKDEHGMYAVYGRYVLF